jgi:predicted TIM-barrel fold metal-dependent hydrolase
VSENNIGRRTLLKGFGMATLAMACMGSADFAEAQAAPNTSGTEVPKLKAPPLACDCHLHIFDPIRFPPAMPGAVPDSTVADYRLFQKRLGLTRSVVVAPKVYVTDNRVTIDAIAQLGPNARGISNVAPTITDAELEVLRRAGIRGVRCVLLRANVGATITTLQRLAKRVNELGWHIDLGANSDQFVVVEELLVNFPAVLVIEHMGWISEPCGINHPGFKVIRKLLDKGRTYVKLSVVGDSKDGPPTFAGRTELAKACLQAAPERMLWGSNWPHPGESQKPDDAMVFDLLSQWAPDEATRHRILVDNPQVLYGF